MKKSKVTKLLSLALVCTMCVSILAGCGIGEQKESESASKAESTSQTQSSSTEGVKELEPVTLKWYLNASEMEGSADVEEAFNALLAEVLPNTTVEFTYVEGYKENWPMFMSGEEVIDIAWGGYDTPFMSDAVNGNLMPLTDLIEEYAPTLQEEWEIWSQGYSTAMYEGELYGIPNIQPTIPESQGFILYENFYENLDNEAFVKEIRSSRKLTSTILDLIEAGVEDAIADGKYVVGATDWKAPNDVTFATRGYILLGTGAQRLYIDPEAENPEPLHLAELPEFKMLLERCAEWYDKGWYTESQIINQMPKDAYNTISFSQAWAKNWGGADDSGYAFFPIESEESYYLVLSNTPDEVYDGPVRFGGESSYLVIPYTAKNPERAIMLIDLLHDEPGTIGNDLANMLCYGFEKDSEEAKKYGWFNYAAVEEDGQLKVDITARGDAASKHEMYNWMVGNTYKIMHDGSSLTLASVKEYGMKFYTEVFPNAIKTPLSGFMCDLSMLDNELSAINALYTEYLPQLRYCSSENVDAVYTEFMEKMNKAGLDTIKAELQSQIDAYIAK